MGKDAAEVRKEFHSRLGQIAGELAKELYPDGLPRGTKVSELEAVAGAPGDEMARHPTACHVPVQADHVPEHGVDSRHHVEAVDQDVLVARSAQRDVQDGPALGGVDLFARVHRVDTSAESASGRQTDQQAQRLVGDAEFGVVEIQADGFGGQALASPGVVGEQLAQLDVLALVDMARARPPRGPLGQSWCGGDVSCGGQGCLRR